MCYTYFYDIYLLAMAEREKEGSDCPQRNTGVARERQRGIWKGDGDGFFSFGVECVVIWDPLLCIGRELMNGYRRETLFGHPPALLSCFFFLFCLIRVLYRRRTTGAGGLMGVLK